MIRAFYREALSDQSNMNKHIFRPFENVIPHWN